VYEEIIGTKTCRLHFRKGKISYYSSFAVGVIVTMLAGRYKVYESEAASNLILTSFVMVGVVPLFQYLAHFL